jgi:hypothetical protein
MLASEGRRRGGFIGRSAEVIINLLVSKGTGLLNGYSSFASSLPYYSIGYKSCSIPAENGLLAIEV